MRLRNGRIVQGRTWGWRERGCPITDGRRYAAEMARRGLQRQTVVGQSTLTVFRLLDCGKVVAELLTNGYGTFPSCANCPIRPLMKDQNVPSDWDPIRECIMPDSAVWSY